MNNRKNDKDVSYVIVDLDGTLVRTDIFFETVVLFVKRNPLNIFLILIWILQGRSYVKSRLAEYIDIDVGNLPYRLSLIDYLKDCRKSGKKLILATASHEKFAHEIADFVGIFDHVLATDRHRNIKGRVKLVAIKELVGEAGFCYAGDSNADIPVWDAAQTNILVNAPASAIETARKKDKVEWILSDNKSIRAAFYREMRVHQWVKNILIFVPIFTSHSYYHGDLLELGLWAFICFSLCASGVYFLNDLLDLEADRQHRSKRSRPLASGELPIPAGILGAVGLPLIAFVLGWFLLPIGFVAILVLYYLLTNAYSFWFKRLATIDVMVLAILYTLRIVAGSVAVAITLSSWLLVFSVFIFLSLAYLKRYIEISALGGNSEPVQGRGYSGADSETMFTLGVSNITASVLVLALYISSDEVVRLYQHPVILWLLCLLIMFWGNRIWVYARRGEISDDPIVFAIKDKTSRIVGVAFAAVVLGAKYISF